MWNGGFKIFILSDTEMAPQRASQITLNSLERYQAAAPFAGMSPYN